MRRNTAAIALALALLPAKSPASAPVAPGMDDALDRIAAYAPQAMREQGTPGLSVAITDRNNTLRIITLGYANRDAQSPVTAQTRFAVGSITKSMTALALLQLADAGRVDLDAPVRRYLPWFSINSSGVPILVRELLAHTSGIPDDFALEIGYVYDVLALRGARTLFTPGTAWSYSNDGFATAGSVLARVDGRTWMDALQARVLTPIGMTSSSPVFTPEALANSAVGYQFRDNDRPPPLSPPLVASPPLDFVDPAGSVLSTPEDMARYIRFYLNEGKTADGTRLISASSFEAMTHAARLKSGSAAGSPGTTLAEAPAFYRRYGYGLSTFDDRGDRLIGHTGGISGYTACMQMNLSRGFGVIAFANLVEAPLHPCAIVLYAMSVLRAQSLGEQLPSPPQPKDPAHVDKAADYAGRYVSAIGDSLDVVREGDRLYLISGIKRIALYPRDSNLFWADDPNFALYLLAFGRDAGRGVVEMTYGPQWYANERYRGPRTFSHPAGWDALAGRYENTYLGDPFVTRVVIVKDRLTFDGVEPLKALTNGDFADGESLVRFDSYAGKIPQRLNIDDIRLYRVELP